MENYEDEDYFLPLEDQRVFGAGITRKRVPFVRSSEVDLRTTSTTNASPAPANPTTGTSIANKYLSIVMPDTPPPPPLPHTESSESSRRTHSAPPPTTAPTTTAEPEPELDTKCSVCNLPLSTTPHPSLEPNSNSLDHSSRPHEASLAHQVCLTHSHPPSHLDRSRHGLRYLESYGWDPDSRLGLGAEGREGIREPVKGRVKVDTVGLGAEVPSPSAAGGKLLKKRKGKVERLNAKQVRKGYSDTKRKGEALREMFYRSDDVLRYLGEG